MQQDKQDEMDCVCRRRICLRVQRHEYARSAWKNGLKLAQELGTNPYKLGLVGSSDAHTGLTAMEEDNFLGKAVPEPSPHRMKEAFIDSKQTGVKIMDWEVSSSGHAGVWANEDTRQSLWDAMQRKDDLERRAVL